MHREWLREAVDLVSDEDYQQAEQMLQRVLDASSDQMPEDHAAVFCAQKDLAMLKVLQRQPAEAYDYVNRAIETFNKCLDGINDLAFVLQDTIQLLRQWQTRLDPANNSVTSEPESLSTIGTAEHLQLIDQQLFVVDEAVRVVFATATISLNT